VIQEVDRALVQHITTLENHDANQSAIDYLTDALLSHLSYEEQEFGGAAGAARVLATPRLTLRERTSVASETRTIGDAKSDYPQRGRW
jgi:hypothetical protein